jgi:hypothetical protein
MLFNLLSFHLYALPSPPPSFFLLIISIHMKFSAIFLIKKRETSKGKGKEVSRS